MAETHTMKPEELSLNLVSMYRTGLELQSKLDKIMDYDSCNEDQASLLGVKQYCL